MGPQCPVSLCDVDDRWVVDGYEFCCDCHARLDLVNLHGSVCDLANKVKVDLPTIVSFRPEMWFALKLFCAAATVFRAVSRHGECQKDPEGGHQVLCCFGSPVGCHHPRHPDCTWEPRPV